MSFPWLIRSRLLDQVANNKNGDRTIWLDGPPESIRRPAGKAMRWVDLSYNTKVKREVEIFQYDYDFPLAVFGKTWGYTTSRVTTQDEEELPASKVYDLLGNKTSPASALCVGPTQYEMQ